MESGISLGDFLRSKRELLTPEDVGLPAAGRRRAQGLRREETAMLAGLSPGVYLRLEQGQDPNPSDDVLDAVARALRLDDDATAQLQRLAHTSPDRSPDPSKNAVHGSTQGRRREVDATVVREHRQTAGPERAPARLASLITAWPNQAVYIQGRLMDVLAANQLARTLSSAFVPGVNGLRAAFLDPSVRELYRDRDAMLSRKVSSLRELIGPNVDDQQLAQLVGDLSVRSEEFRDLWAQREVQADRNGLARFRHPQVGDFDLHYEKLAIDGSDGQLLIILHAEPGTPSEAAFRRLGAIAAGSVEAQRVLPAPVQIESKRRLP